MGDFTGEEYHNHSKVPQDVFKPMPTNQPSELEDKLTERLTLLFYGTEALEDYRNDGSVMVTVKQAVNLFLELLSTSQREAREEAQIKGRITGLEAAHRYKGSPFEVGAKILKEIKRLENLTDSKGV